MSKVINVRIREDIRKKYPNITSSLGNDLIYTILLLQESILNDFNNLPDPIKTEIKPLIIDTKIRPKDGLRICASRLQNKIDRGSFQMKLYFNELHRRIGDAGLLVLYYALVLEE